MFYSALAEGRIDLGKMPTPSILKEARFLAEAAGFIGAKLTSHLLPRSLPNPIKHISIHLDQRAPMCLNIYCLVQAEAHLPDKEVLAAVQNALLGLYDLVEPPFVSTVSLLYKQEGLHVWLHPEGLPDRIKPLLGYANFKDTEVSIVKISDRGSLGTYPDLESNKQILLQKLSDMGMKVVSYTLIPNDPVRIRETLLDVVENSKPQLILTTGGTGLSARDTTPETVSQVCDRLIPGLSELLRKEGSRYSDHSWLSRSVAGMIQNTLVLTLPGKPNAVLESLAILQNLLPHALQTLTEKKS